MVRRVATILVLLVVVAGAGAFWIRQRLVTPYRGFQDPEVLVDLPAGTSEREIARRLAAAQVVPDALTFRVAAWLAHADRRLQAGEYRFADPATPGEIVSRLVRGDVDRRGVTFPEGLTIGVMASIFERGGLGTAAEFERAASDGTLVHSLDPDAPTLEGYLFPATYSLSRRAGAAGAVSAMLAQFTR